MTPLAPEIQSLLAWSKVTDRIHTSLALPELRDAVHDALDRELRRRGVEVEPVHKKVDEWVSVAGRRIRVRLFRPAGYPPFPVYVHFHGGGFVFGTIDSLVNDAKCAHICRAAECVVATVDYRLAPEHRFPAAPEDCYAALRWIVDNAKRLDVDAARVAVGGESAGGNLGAVVALMARDRGGPRLALQLLEVPVTDISRGAADHPSVALFGEGYGLDRADMEYFTAQYLGDPAEGSNPYASPLLAGEVAGVAPAHVITAEFDVLRDSGEAYARILREAGVETTLERKLGHTHGSSVLWQTWAPAREWMEDVVGALRRAFDREEDEWHRSSSKA
ncbi:MAG TPA: alpha/beta hydrolase fold domain-containing protein [Solirubrobacteraceae bacterium]|jgi:acetyl esterase